MPINYFKTGADTGLADSTAIQPIENGDPVEETYLNRAPGNLQSRSESVRTSFDYLQQIVMANSGLTLYADKLAQCIFHDTGGGQYKFKINSTGLWATLSDYDLFIVPIISAAKFSGSVPLYAKYRKSFGGGAGYLELTSVLRVCAGGHNIQVRLFKITGESTGLPAISIEGATDPDHPNLEVNEHPVTIAVQIADNDTTTIQQIVTAILGHLPALTLVAPAVVGTGSTIVEELADPVRLYEGDAGSNAGLDDAGVKIASTTLESFFGAPANYMTEGSVLIVDLVSAQARQTQNPLTSINTSDMAILKSGMTNQNLGDCDGIIPIAKMFNGQLILLNGKVVAPDDPQFVDVGNRFNVLYASSILGAGGGTLSLDNLTITGNLTAGDATGDLHTFKGTFLHTDVAGTAKNFKISGTAGRAGFGVEPDATALVHVGSKGIIVSGADEPVPSSNYVGLTSNEDTSSWPALFFYVDGGVANAKRWWVRADGSEQLSIDAVLDDGFTFASYLTFQHDGGSDAYSISFGAGAAISFPATTTLTGASGSSLGTSGSPFGYLYLSTTDGKGVGAHLKPTTNGDKDLGSSGRKWGVAWLTTAQIGTLSNNSSAVTVGDDLVPSSGKDLGSSTTRWTEAWITTANVTTLQNNGSDITVHDDLIPNTDGINLGDSDNGYNVYAYTMHFDVALYTAGGGANEGTILMPSGVGATNSAGFIQVVVAGTPYYIPVFSSIS